MGQLCPSSPLGWEYGRQTGLDPSVNRPTELEPSEAKGHRGRCSQGPAPGSSCTCRPTRSLRVGNSALVGPVLVPLSPTWPGPRSRLVSTPKGAALRAGPGHSDWQWRGPTGSAPGCVGSRLWTGYSDGRAGPPAEVGGRAASTRGRGRSGGNPKAGSGFTLRFRMAETTSPPVALSAAWHSWCVTPCTPSSTCRAQSLAQATTPAWSPVCTLGPFRESSPP